MKTIDIYDDGSSIYVVLDYSEFKPPASFACLLVEFNSNVNQIWCQFFY